MNIFQAILIAIVEGLTEFLPISSTGHMVITSALMHIDDDAFTKYFEVCIQFGAILSVLILYFKRFIGTPYVLGQSFLVLIIRPYGNLIRG